MQATHFSDVTVTAYDAGSEDATRHHTLPRPFAGATGLPVTAVQPAGSVIVPVEPSPHTHMNSTSPFTTAAGTLTVTVVPAEVSAAVVGVPRRAIATG